jgi:anti-sigma regulatory factor (Ser/Thr protein kinase)
MATPMNSSVPKLPTPQAEAIHHTHGVRVIEDVGALRRAVVTLATRCLPERVGDAALAATELATNLVRHTTSGGYVLYREVADGFELLAVDAGPGMGNRAFVAGRDRAAEIARRTDMGFTLATTGGEGDLGPGRLPGAGLGVGLSSVERLATTFDLYSSRPGDTVVLARITHGLPRRSWCRFGGLNLALGDAAESGDCFTVALDQSLAALIVDGLGHGPAAAEASATAAKIFGNDPFGDLGSYVAKAHEAMRATRGGVLAVCSVDPNLGRLRYAGVGNITGRVFNGEQHQSLASRDGVLGTRAPSPPVQVVETPWLPGSTLVMATDGLRTDWDLSAYPGLMGHDPVVIAATLHRDQSRGADDVAVLVIEDLRTPAGA